MKALLLALLSLASVFLLALPQAHAAFTHAGVRPGLAFVVSLWAAARLPLPSALLVPALTGLAADALSSARPGTYTLVFFLACLPAAALQRVFSFRLLPVFLSWTLILSMVKGGLETVACAGTLGRWQAFAFARSALIPELILNTLLALPVFGLPECPPWLA